MRCTSAVPRRQVAAAIRVGHGHGAFSRQPEHCTRVAGRTRGMQTQAGGDAAARPDFRHGARRLGPHRAALLRRAGGADRAHASGPGRRAPLAGRAHVPVRLELLHAVAGPRGHAARHLFRLAPARRPRRPGGGAAVRRAGRAARAGAVDPLRRLRPDPAGGGPVYRRQGRRPRHRAGGAGPAGAARLEGRRRLACRRGGLRRPLLPGPAVPAGDCRCRRSRATLRAPAAAPPPVAGAGRALRADAADHPGLARRLDRAARRRRAGCSAPTTCCRRSPGTSPSWRW